MAEETKTTKKKEEFRPVLFNGKAGILTTPFGRFNLNGTDVRREVLNRKGKKENQLWAKGAKQADLKRIYDAGPTYQQYIIAPKEYEAPWEKKQ
jgi:hypothetical protein